MSSNMTTQAAVNNRYDSPVYQVSWSMALALTLVAYATACSFLRFRRFKDVHARFKYPDRESFSRMTNEDAQAIVHTMSSWECPLFFDLGLRYALFKVRMRMIPAPHTSLVGFVSRLTASKDICRR